LWLTRLAVGVRIIDKAAEPGTTSRALAVQAYTVSRGPNSVTVQGEGKRVVKLHVWRCLPDTVDPRPKGK
jgi:hypothetical protein